MSEYLEKICIFICLTELLGNFLPSPKFAKLYRYISGVLVLLIIIKPLGDSVIEVLEQKGDSLAAEFEESLQGQEMFWELEDSYLEEVSEEELAEYLQPYGYDREETEGSEEVREDGEMKADIEE